MPSIAIVPLLTFCRPMMARSRLDLPTFDRPAKATSGRSAGGMPSIFTAPIMKATGWANRTRAASMASSCVVATKRTVGPSLDRFLNVVRQGGGEVAKVDIWGRRRLAYDIKKKSEGIYVVVTMSAEPATAQELDSQLNLSESVMRTKLLRPGA